MAAFGTRTPIPEQTPKATETLEPAADRRASAAPRKRCLLTGRVVYGRGTYTVDCVIRNLSETGAQVKLLDGGAQSLPNEVTLIDSRSFTAYDSIVKWHRENLVGVEFVRTYSLEDASTPELKQLRNLAVEAQRRPTG